MESDGCRHIVLRSGSGPRPTSGQGPSIDLALQRDRVWIGGGVIICPGVTIESDTTIGAGSVVTRNIPAGVLAVGNPCRVIRTLA